MTTTVANVRQVKLCYCEKGLLLLLRSVSAFSAFLNPLVRLSKYIIEVHHYYCYYLWLLQGGAQSKPVKACVTMCIINGKATFWWINVGMQRQACLLAALDVSTLG